MKEIFERISIRKFEDKLVEHEKTEQGTLMSTCIFTMKMSGAFLFPERRKNEHI